MSSDMSGDAEEASDGETEDTPTVAELKTQLEILREENQRLRTESRRLQHTRYRRTALGLFAVSIVAAVAAGLFPDARTLFVVLASIGAFGGVLTYYLTPERFLAASVSDRIYASVASDGRRLVEEFGLTDHRLYVPTGADGTTYLFIPQHEEFALPDAEELEPFAVVPPEERKRGISVEPTGARLYDAFDRRRTTAEPQDVGVIADQFADAIVEQFDLAAATNVDVDGPGGRITVGIDDSTLGSVTRFDHPVPSFIATGMALELGRPVEMTISEPADRRVDAHVTCRWDTDGEDGAENSSPAG